MSRDGKSFSFRVGLPLARSTIETVNKLHVQIKHVCSRAYVGRSISFNMICFYFAEEC